MSFYNLPNRSILYWIKKQPFYHFLWKSYHKNKSNKMTIYDQKLLYFYSQFIKEGDLCFDIGANIGNRSKIFLKLGAIVVAVEPQEECTDILRNNYGDNKNLNILEIALGDQEGSGEMIIGDLHVLSTLSKEWAEKVKDSGRFKEHRWSKKRTVKIKTLDSLIKIYGKPIFIKIDVEGYEYKVLKGLSEPVKFISFEFTQECIDQIPKIFNHLGSLGRMKVNFSLGESLSLNLDKWEEIPHLMDILENMSDKLIGGDIYVRFD